MQSWSLHSPWQFTFVYSSSLLEWRHHWLYCIQCKCNRFFLRITDNKLYRTCVIVWQLRLCKYWAMCMSIICVFLKEELMVHLFIHHRKTHYCSYNIYKNYLFLTKQLMHLIIFCCDMFPKMRSTTYINLKFSQLTIKW